MGILGNIFGKGKKGGEVTRGGSGGGKMPGPTAAATSSGTPEIYDAAVLERVLKDQPEEITKAFRALTLGEAAASSEAAALWLLARLRADAKLRAEFPEALSAGGEGEFAQWLQTPEAAQRLGIPMSDMPAWEQVQTHLATAFTQDPGAPVLQLWLLKQTWQERYPLFLCSTHIKDPLRWILRRGPEEFGVSQAAVLWFFQSWAEQVERAAGLTYRVRPEWQSKFPVLLESSAQQSIFRRWLREEFGLELDAERLQRELAVRPLTSDPQAQPVFEPGLKSQLKATGESLLPVETKAQKQLGINVLGHFCYPSGLQQAVLGFTRAARKAGLAVSTRDVPAAHETRALPRTVDLLGLEVYSISVLMIYPNAFFPKTYALAGLVPAPGVRRIAYWFWESESVPDEVVAMADGMQEIWVATEYVAAAFRNRLPRKPVHVIMPSLEPPAPAALTREELGLLPQGAGCVFAFVFDMTSTVERKNPIGLVEAFGRAFGAADGVQLVIKTQRGERQPEQFAELEAVCGRYTNVLLVNDVWPIERVHALIDACDCYVSLHRSEGLGLTMAEAMYLGKPVIATGYSGNVDFMDESNSLLVPAERVTTKEDSTSYVAGTMWSEPDLEAAANYMQWVYHNREAAAALGAKASVDVQRLMSASACGARIRERAEASYRAAHENAEAREMPTAAMNATSAKRALG